MVFARLRAFLLVFKPQVLFQDLDLLLPPHRGKLGDYLYFRKRYKNYFAFGKFRHFTGFALLLHPRVKVVNQHVFAISFLNLSSFSHSIPLVALISFS